MILNKIKEHFNFKMAGAAALAMGVLIFATQYHTVAQVWPATTAALKQLTYTFFASAILIVIVESVVKSLFPYKYSAFFGIMAAWLFTSVASAIVHSLKGTADPADAIILNILVAPPGLIFIAFRKKKQLKKEAVT